MIDLHSVFVYNIKCKRERVNLLTVYQQLFFTIYQQLMNYYTSLVKEDYSLLNDIIIEYVENLTDKQFDDYEDYINNNINEIM